MFLFRVWEDKDVIKVDNTAYVQQITEGTIYIYLECGWGIGKSKWYDCILKIFIPSLESHYPFFTFFDLNAVVYIPQV